MVDESVNTWLLDNPGAKVIVDVADRTLTLPDGREISFPLDDFSQHCLMQGVDQLGYLLQQNDGITQFESNRTWQP